MGQGRSAFLKYGANVAAPLPAKVAWMRDTNGPEPDGTKVPFRTATEVAVRDVDARPGLG